MARSRLIFQTVSGMGLLTGPHQTSFVDVGSSTIRLSTSEIVKRYYTLRRTTSLAAGGSCQCTGGGDGRSTFVDKGIFIQ